MGRAARRLGRGFGAAGGAAHRRRDPRQHRRHVGAQGAGQGRQHLPPALPAALGRRRALPVAAGALRGHAAGQWRPARPAAAQGRAQVHGRVQGRAAGEAALRRQTRSGADRLARHLFLCLHRSRAQRRGRALARPVRPDHRRHPAGRRAPVPAAERQAAVGDLAVPVPPVPVAGGLTPRPAGLAPRRPLYTLLRRGDVRRARAGMMAGYDSSTASASLT
ncbi:hypothetical protein CBM2587_B80270 [Cupriavidus taiwanensis]|uniref:Uncharacterized protein n=1 Tax=Cupriavidus taiwanensis TaxID=164546 RepID=A0A975XDJ1_9BURK|nr:hypothetical protein CBM2587_B80270 [Cupriavidus taiwanensis]